MTKISKYQLNTHFTALKQLPNQYTATISFGGTYGFVLGQVLASTSISVPAGAYVEMALLRPSIDGNTNYLAHEVTYNINNYAYLVFSLYQTSSSTYQLRAVLTNSDYTTVTIPNSTLTAILRLAQAPFNI